MNEDDAKRLAKDITSDEIPKFLANPEYFIYSSTSGVLTNFTLDCGIKNISNEFDELDIYTGQEVPSTNLDKVKEKYCKKINEFIDFVVKMTTIEDFSQRREIIRELTKKVFKLNGFVHMTTKFLLLTDLVKDSEIFMAINKQTGKKADGMSFLRFQYTKCCEMCKEYIKMFDGNFDKAEFYLTKAKNIVDKKYE